jgi:hypothetical protein
MEEQEPADDADHGDGEGAPGTERESGHVSTVPVETSHVGDAIATKA